MSQENVEIVRQHYEDFSEAWDQRDPQALLERFDPDFEWWDRGDEPAPTVHRGHEGV